MGKGVTVHDFAWILKHALIYMKRNLNFRMHGKIYLLSIMFLMIHGYIQFFK